MYSARAGLTVAHRGLRCARAATAEPLSAHVCVLRTCGEGRRWLELGSRLCTGDCGVHVQRPPGYCLLYTCVSCTYMWRGKEAAAAEHGLTCPVLPSCPIMPCPALSYPVLSCREKRYIAVCLLLLPCC